MSADSNPADFVRSGGWRSRFDDEVLAAARALASKVKNLRVEPLGDGEFTLSASVVDGEVLITLWPDDRSGWEFETQCSCEVSNFCHHAAATMIKAGNAHGAVKWSGSTIGSAIASELHRHEVPAAKPESARPRITASPTFELHVVREPVDPASRLLLESLGQPKVDQWIVAEAWAIYDGQRLPLRASMPHWETELSLPDGRLVVLDHDAVAENRAAYELTDSGLSSLQANSAWRLMLRMKSRDRDRTSASDRWFPDPSRIETDHFWHQFRGERIYRLLELGWQVKIDDNVGHRVFDADPAQWQSAIEPAEGGWFSLSVGFDVAGERHDLLPILARLLEGDFLEETLHCPDTAFVYAPLPHGDALKLPAGRVRRILNHLASLIDPKFPAKTRIHALDAVSLSGLNELGIDPSPEIAELGSRLQNFSGISDIPAPAGLNATLREYQLSGFRWMQFLGQHGLHGILADDMGLGKTLQTLAHILADKESGRSRDKPCLVVAPTSVVPNWLAETKKFAPRLRTLVLTGPERKRYLRSIPHADIVLTSYALLHRDIGQLQAQHFHLVVLDEAQQIKNPQAKVAQAACKLHANHRLCLSGTPVENHLGELWSLMKFLIPGFLGSEEHFNEQFRKPIEIQGDSERNAALKKRIAPLVLRRTKDQVAKELPPKTELVHLIELHTGQKDLYETVRATMNKRVREAIAARGMSQFQMVFLDALLKLRQICCDPRLLPDDFANTVQESAKLDFLSDLLSVLIEEGRRILLFSQFTTMLRLIEEQLLGKSIPYLKLTGSSKDRGKLVEDFQTGKIPLFLISLKAGGTGLNLTAADTVIHYDPWWNPAAEAQATDRAYRIGQKNPVFVHKLLCQDTVEQRIHQMQQQKAQLAADLLSDADISQRLSPEMMQALLD
ncbi:MAG: DEAD/DEAH box helicase [Luteolibacter sp.]